MHNIYNNDIIKLRCVPVVSSNGADFTNYHKSGIRKLTLLSNPPHAYW